MILSTEAQHSLLAVLSTDGGRLCKHHSNLWSHSYLKPMPQPTSTMRSRTDTHILTLQKTAAKLMELFVIMKLAQNLGRRNILKKKQGGYRAGKATWDNAARFVYAVYEGFRKKEQTLVV